MSNHLFAALVALSASVVVVSGQAPSANNPRLDKLKQWMALAEEHQPGRVDPAAEAVRDWDRQWLQDVRDDMFAVRQLICGKIRPVNGGRCQAIPTNVPGGQQLANHVQIRSRQGREWAGPFSFRHMVDLTSLADEIDRLDINDILKRGALLHTDIAFRTRPPVTWGEKAQALFLLKTSVNVADGRESGVSHSVDHLEMARRLLDIVTPDPRKDLDTYPERDAMVRSWYHATMALLLDVRHLDIRHKTAGAELFPEDDEVLVLAGAMHEALASPSFQQGMETRSVSGVAFIESERIELTRAEDFFRRALKTNPAHAEARLRLGQVLAQRGRTADALVELNAAARASTDPLISYYAALLIGRTDDDVARASAAFRQAAALYPRAQSPHIGLSEIEMRLGNSQAAARTLDALWALQAASPDDSPWSSYWSAAGRRGSAQFDAIGASFPPKGGRP